MCMSKKVSLTKPWCRVRIENGKGKTGGGFLKNGFKKC